MKESPVDIKVSVIVVTYNQEATIGRTLDSIISQKTDFPFEIIIGDDASTDRTAEICQEYVKRYPNIITLHVNDSNTGVQANYFDSLLRCRGKYIADCAGDDFWIDNDKLQKEAEMLDSDEEIVLVHTDWQYYNEITGCVSPCDPQGKKTPYLPPLSERESLFLPILQHKAAPIIHLCTSLYRKDALLKYYYEDKNLFRDKEFGCEDLQVSACLAHEGKIGYLSDVTLNYSVGHASIMSVEDPRKVASFYKGSIRLIEYIRRKFDVPYDKLRDCYAERIEHIYAQAFTIHDREMAHDAIEMFKDYHVSVTKKVRIKSLLTLNDTVWRLSLKLNALWKKYR